MTRNPYRFGFVPTVSLTEAELTLHLAMYAAEGVHGEAGVRLDVSYRIDQSANAIIVDGETEVGATLVKVFTQLLLRQFGEDGFHVRRVEQGSAADQKSATRQNSAEVAVA